MTHKNQGAGPASKRENAKKRGYAFFPAKNQKTYRNPTGIQPTQTGLMPVNPVNNERPTPIFTPGSNYLMTLRMTLGFGRYVMVEMSVPTGIAGILSKKSFSRIFLLFPACKNVCQKQTRIMAVSQSEAPGLSIYLVTPKIPAQ